MSGAVNQRALYDEICHEFEEQRRDGRVGVDSLVPSASWFYKQFAPADGRRFSAARLTGRFQVCLRVLSRTWRKPHADEHFCAALKRYLLHMCVRFRDEARFVSFDDKNNIPVGHPGLPIAAIERGRRVLVAKASSGVQAMDHDAGSGGQIKFIPTVTLLRKPPREMDDPWLRGTVSLMEW